MRWPHSTKPSVRAGYISSSTWPIRIANERATPLPSRPFAHLNLTFRRGPSRCPLSYVPMGSKPQHVDFCSGFWRHFLLASLREVVFRFFEGPPPPVGISPALRAKSQFKSVMLYLTLCNISEIAFLRCAAT